MTTKKPLIIGSLLLLVAAIPATLLMTQEEQDTRTRATASTTLSYTPNSTNTAPIVKTIGDTVAFDIIVTPGSNLPSLVKLEMQYDATKFDPAANPFVVNTSAFPATIEGPIIMEGRVLISVSIGNDVTKAIQQPTKVGTLNLITKADTAGTPTQLTFGDRSQILSLAQNDEATENVLATTQPSFVTIETATTPTTLATVTTAPPATTIPTQYPSVTINATEHPTPTPTSNPTSTMISLNIFMHGIGNSGDNVNPMLSELSNKQPQHPSKEVTITLYNDQNQLVLTKTGLVTYASSSGSFIGEIDLGTTVQSGVYTIRVKEETHLRRLIPGIQQLVQQITNPLPTFALVAGDINNDNTINILDYNLLVGCYSDLLPAISCTDENKTKTDLNDNGAVNQFDYNLFLREITVQTGN